MKVVKGEEGYMELANGIVLKAVDDYKSSIDSFLQAYFKKNSDEMKVALDEIYEVEDFFMSDWFKTLTELNPEKVLELRVEETPRLAIEAYQSKIVSDSLVEIVNLTEELSEKLVKLKGKIKRCRLSNKLHETYVEKYSDTANYMNEDLSKIQKQASVKTERLSHLLSLIKKEKGEEPVIEIDEIWEQRLKEDKDGRR